MFKKIHHVTISVRDINRSKEFYELLGFKVWKKFNKPDLGAEVLMLKLGETILEIFGFEKYEKPKQDIGRLNVVGVRHFAIEVEDIKEVYKKLTERGYEVTEPKKGSSGFMYCFTKDPDGIPIEFLQ